MAASSIYLLGLGIRCYRDLPQSLTKCVHVFPLPKEYLNPMPVPTLVAEFDGKEQIFIVDFILNFLAEKFATVNKENAEKDFSNGKGF